jgi:hypothetical protein
MIDQLSITNSTTRNELIAYVTGLEDVIEELETKIQDQKSEIENLTFAPQQLERLTEAADLMAELGRIHNTPHAKYRWISGN